LGLAPYEKRTSSPRSTEDPGRTTAEMPGGASPLLHTRSTWQLKWSWLKKSRTGTSTPSSSTFAADVKGSLQSPEAAVSQAAARFPAAPAFAPAAAAAADAAAPPWVGCKHVFRSPDGWDQIPDGLVEVDPQHRRFGGCESDFALQRLVECRALETERVRLIALRWHSSGSQVRLGLSWACRKRRRQKLAVRNTASTPTPSFTRRGLDRRSNPGAVEMPSLSRSCPTE